MSADAVHDDDIARMTLVEHLGELRDRLIKAVLAVAVGAAIAFATYDTILAFLLDPYCQVLPEDQPCRLVIREPLEGFATRVRVAGYSGVFLASPVVLWQLWRFITPGLHPTEKRYAIPFVLSSAVLFSAGGAVALVTFPKALEFLIAVGGENTETLYSPSGYLRLVTLMVMAFGLAFLFPVVLTFLQLAGVLTPQKLASWRRGAIVAVIAAAAVITPSQDPVSLFAMAGPMIIFYEASILIGRLAARSKARRAAEA